eukprot:1189488-Prorocentrum_minimum.AAC.1
MYALSSYASHPSVRYRTIIVTTTKAKGCSADDAANQSVVPGQKVVDAESGVTLLGYTDLSNRMPQQTSHLYASNVVNMLELMGGAADPSAPSAGPGQIGPQRAVI